MRASLVFFLCLLIRQACTEIKDALPCARAVIGRAPLFRRDSGMQPEAGQRAFVKREGGYAEVVIEGVSPDGTIRIFDPLLEVHSAVKLDAVSSVDRSSDIRRSNDMELKKLFHARPSHARHIQLNVSEVPALASRPFLNHMSALSAKIWNLQEKFPNQANKVEALQELWLEVEEKVNAIIKGHQLSPELVSLLGHFIPKELIGADDLDLLKAQIEIFQQNLNGYQEKLLRIVDLSTRLEIHNRRIAEAKSTLIDKYAQVLKDPRSIEVLSKADQLSLEFDSAFQLIGNNSDSTNSSSAQGLWASIRQRLAVPLLKPTKVDPNVHTGKNDPSVLIENNSDMSPFEFDFLLHMLRKQKTQLPVKTLEKLERLASEYKSHYEKSPVALIRTLRADYALLRANHDAAKTTFEGMPQILNKSEAEIRAAASEMSKGISSNTREASRIESYWKEYSLATLTAPSKDRGASTVQIPFTPGFAQLGISPIQHAHIDRHFQESVLREMEPYFYALKARMKAGEITEEAFNKLIEDKLDNDLNSKVDSFIKATNKNQHTVFPAHIFSRDVFEALTKTPAFLAWKAAPKPMGSSGAKLTNNAKDIVPWEGSLSLKGSTYKVVVWGCANSAGCSGGYKKGDIVTLYPISGSGILRFESAQ